MIHRDVRKKYIDFFVKSPRNHKEVPSASLVPENDPTTLFVSSGMQPLVPYLLGEKHPLGTRLVNSQKSFRAQDIDEVGDNRHTTFFEMLGNWSLGDYFKEKQLQWCFEFLTHELGLDSQKLYVTVFEGNTIVPKDTESIDIWKNIFSSVGIDAKIGERIFTYGVEKNWWSRSGIPDRMPNGEPGGPDSEVFYEFTHVKHNPAFGKVCHPNCDCGRFLEIGNSVFMQYQKQVNGSFKELPQKNVDFGGGLERLVAVTQNQNDLFKTDLFAPLIQQIEKFSSQLYTDPIYTSAMRVIADHIKAATFLISDGVIPSNKAQGYVLRRLLRRAAVKMQQLRGSVSPGSEFSLLASEILKMYDGIYFPSERSKETLFTIINDEMDKFSRSLEKGLKILSTLTKPDAKIVFDLYQSHGFPLEITKEILEKKGLSIDEAQFTEEFQKHKDLSRTTSSGMFRGGLADHSEQVVKLHTATHLLQQALRGVLGDHVRQKGSHITAERLRFDFTHPTHLTDAEIKKIEILVNKTIGSNLSVSMEILSFENAKKNGALYVEGEKYPEQVKVYSIGDYSQEICGGPHVSSTERLGSFKVTKEESLGTGVRRIYATVS